jgi:hypothetical protein
MLKNMFHDHWAFWIILMAGAMLLLLYYLRMGSPGTTPAIPF